MNRSDLTSSVVISLALFLCTVVTVCHRPPASKGIKAVPKTIKEISFGRRQVDQMLADRPDMVGILSDDDPILSWIISSMNGERIGQRIYWNGGSPLGDAPAEHWIPYGAYAPHIRITDGVDTAIDKWTYVIYELFNLENEASFTSLHKDAYSGAIHGDAYATECARLEYVALVKAKEFFQKYPFPGAKSGENPEYDSIGEVPATFEEYMATFTDERGVFHHPGGYFKDFYDTNIAPYVMPERKYKRRNENQLK